MKTMHEPFEKLAAANARPLSAILILCALTGCARTEVSLPTSAIRPVSSDAVNVDTTHLDLPALPQLPARGWM